VFVREASSDHFAESQIPDDPARGLRRLLALLVLLALAAAAGAFALSQRGSGSTKPHLPALFPARFTETGFLSGDATLVSSYDGGASATRTTATVTARGNVYVVVLCRTDIVRIAVGSLTSTRDCTGSPDGVLALNLTQDVQLTATVSKPQGARWGVAIYR
jgi:hypothetical protein